MERWVNKVALVTGAGSGIGAQIARDLCAKQVIVYGLDFSKDGLEKVSQDIANDKASRFNIIYCDLTNEEEIESAFTKVISENGGVDILVNCAGILESTSILEVGSDESINKIIQTNLLAVISCTKKAFRSMSDRDVEGHIVNLCSTAGHGLPNLHGMKPAFGAYSMSKVGVNFMNRAIGQELVYYQKPKIRISNISPAIVGDTAIFKETVFDGELTKEDTPLLKPKDISDVLMFILAAPGHVQIRDVILESVGAAYY